MEVRNNTVFVPQRSPYLELPLYAIVLEVPAAIAVFLGLFTILKAIFAGKLFLKRFNLQRGTGVDIACKMVSAIFAMGAATVGLIAMTAPESWKRQVHLIDHVILVVTAYFLYDTLAMFRVYEARAEEKLLHATNGNGLHKSERKSVTFWDFTREQPLLMAHHLSLALFFCPLMCFNLDHEPGDLMVGCALVFEASTPFVSLRAILSYLDLKSSLAYLINGLAMVVVFPLCRILIFPWFYSRYGALRGLGLIEAVRSTPTLCSVFMTVVLLPQLYWYKLMVRGAMKVLEARADAKVKANGKSD